MKKFFLILSIFVIFDFFGCKSAKKVEATKTVEIVNFQDPVGINYSFVVNNKAAFHKFDKEKFKKIDDKIFYDDENYEVRHGLDISRHEKKVNWKKIKEAGYDFIILRVGYRGYQTGILHIDENFHKNIKGALAAGLDIGVYVFSQAINEEETLEEVALVLNEIKGYDIKLPVCFDPEKVNWDWARTDNISGDVFTKNTILFCEKIKEAGYEPMIYANHYWEAFLFDMEALKDYKFWYADYVDIPQLPYNFEFWQYTATQVVDGIKKKCDADIWIRRIERD